MTVRLGDRTLVGHVQAIWHTRASQDLVHGTEQKVGDLVNRATNRVVKDVVKNAPDSVVRPHAQGSENPQGESPPLEELPAKDRHALRGIIGHRAGQE